MKKHFHIFLLVGVILLKLSSVMLHQYIDHNDAASHGDVCELCEYAVHNQDVDSGNTLAFCEIEAYAVTPFVKENFYKSIYKKQIADQVLFGRPPPSSLV